MAERAVAVVRPVWKKQAEEAKLKEEEQKAAAARAAFDATFKDVEKDGSKEAPSSDSEADEAEKLANKPIGPVDPSKCTAAGTGVGGGAACSAASFVVVTKDFDGRRVPHGGAQIKVKITPGLGVGGVEQEALVKDHGDGTYTVTYAVAKRGDYMVRVECNGKPILGSPFPVFFSAGTLPLNGGLFNSSGNVLGSASYANGVNQSMPNYSGMMPGLFSGMLGMIPGILPGASGGAVLPGLGASFGEVCREYLYGRCSKSDCRFNHPPQNQLMAALAAGSTMGGLSQMPMAPSAAAMAAAQTIVAAQALQAHAAQAQAQTAGESAGLKPGSGSPSSPSKGDKVDAILRTLQVSNLSPLLTSEQLRQLFSYCGTVTDCQIADSKQLAYVEYAKPEEAKAALAMNNMEVGGRPLNVEMAKSLPSKKTSVANATVSTTQQPPLPMMMQQAVAMQQLQFQQALIMQQSMASQQAASRAATMKSATEMASARAAEISKRLKGDGNEHDVKDASRKSRSRSRSRARSRSRSRSPVRYRRDRHSRSRSPAMRYQRDRRSRSPMRPRHRHRSRSRDQIYHYRDSRDDYGRYRGRHHQGRSRDQYVGSVRRNRSRSRSRTRRSSRAGSVSPTYRKERKTSPKLYKEEHKSSRHSRRSRSLSKELRQDILEEHKSSRHSRRSRSLSKELRQDILDKEGVDKSKNHKVGLEKSEKEVDEVTEKHNHAQKDLMGTGEDKHSKELNKPKSHRKITTKIEEGMTWEDTKDTVGRNSAKPSNRDGFNEDMNTNERIGVVLKELKGDAGDDQDFMEKKWHMKESEVDDDEEEELTEKKLHKKERKMDDDGYEWEEKKIHRRDRKAVDDEEELKEKKRQRKRSELGCEGEEGSKRHRRQNKKEDGSEKMDKKKKKHKHRRRSASDSVEESADDDVDRGNSSRKKDASRHNRKYRAVSKSVSPGLKFQD